MAEMRVRESDSLENAPKRFKKQCEKLRYISLPADYFPLFLIIGIGATGVLTRYFFKVNVVGVKELTMG